MKNICIATLLLGSLVGCRDASKLVGDSNVYGQPIEMEFLRINSQSESNEEGSLLTTEVDDDFLLVNHKNLPFPCGHDVERYAEAEWSDEFIIFIDYKTGQTASDEKCPTDLEFTLDVVKAELLPGVYTVACVSDETRCDLTEILEE